MEHLPDDEQKRRKKMRLQIVIFALLGALMLVISFIAGKTIREKLDNAEPVSITMEIVHEV